MVMIRCLENSARIMISYYKKTNILCQAYMWLPNAKYLDFREGVKDG